MSDAARFGSTPRRGGLPVRPPAQTAREALKAEAAAAEALSAVCNIKRGRMGHCVGEESSVKPKRYTAAHRNIILVVEKREDGTYALVDFVLLK